MSETSRGHQDQQIKNEINKEKYLSGNLITIIKRQKMNGNPKSDVMCTYFVALGDLSIDLLGH
jgi:hypothetical protein